MRKPYLLILGSLCLTACFPAPPEDGGGGGGPVGGPCDLVTAVEGQAAGYPYSVDDFRTNILPKLQLGCELGSSCHGVGSSPGLFQVFSAANVGEGCADIQTFNQVVARSKYMEGGAASPIVQKIDGTLTHMFPATSPASMEMAMLLLTFIDNAQATAGGGGPGPSVDGGVGSDGGGGGGGVLDPNVYATQIHQILTGSGCTNANCHNVDDGAQGGNFGLHPRAIVGTQNVTDNVAAIAMRIDTSLPATQANMTEFYIRCTDSHLGAVVSNPQAIEDWIAASLGQ